MINKNRIKFYGLIRCIIALYGALLVYGGAKNGKEFKW